MALPDIVRPFWLHPDYFSSKSLEKDPISIAALSEDGVPVYDSNSILKKKGEPVRIGCLEAEQWTALKAMQMVISTKMECDPLGPPGLTPAQRHNVLSVYGQIEFDSQDAFVLIYQSVMESQSSALFVRMRTDNRESVRLAGRCLCGKCDFSWSAMAWCTLLGWEVTVDPG